MILASKVNAVINDNRRAINFKPRLEIPDQRTIFRIKAVEMMIQAAGENFVVDKYRCGFEAVLALELPNDAAIVSIQAIDVAIGGRKIDAIVTHRRLSRP